MAWSLHLLLSIAVVAASAYRLNTNPKDYERQEIVKLDPESLAESSNVSHSHIIEKRAIQNRRIRPRTPVFVKTTPAPIKSAYKPKIDKSCENYTFCEIDHNYPQEAIDKAIEKLGHVSLQIDILDRDASVPLDFTQRMGLPLEKKIELCETKSTHIIYPKYGVDFEGRPVSLVNRDKDKNPVQGFQVSICKEEGCKCNNIIEKFHPGYSARCIQHYMFRPAAAFRELENDEIDIFPAQVRLPSHCSCVGKLDPTTTTTSI